jgi:triphosphoribosyl-dephospho-CoA synthase
MRRVGCNTNLGILLLLAPLVHAVLVERGGDLRSRLGRVLRALDVADAADAYIAIGRASPAGLGAAAQQDVVRPPTVTLLEAMRLAAERDRIALQYASDFADIFEVGVPAIEASIAHGWPAEGAAVRCYLEFLARFPDSHVVRKYGAAAAEAVRRDAIGVETRIKACDNLGSAVPILLKMDNKLKAGGINPGTSADLTIASLAAWRLKALL